MHNGTQNLHNKAPRRHLGLRLLPPCANAGTDRPSPPPTEPDSFHSVRTRRCVLSANQSICPCALLSLSHFRAAYLPIRAKPKHPFQPLGADGWGWPAKQRINNIFWRSQLAEGERIARLVRGRLPSTLLLFVLPFISFSHRCNVPFGWSRR